VTGISDNATTLSTKRLGLLKQAVPSLRKVAMLWNKEDLGMTLRYQSSADAAKSLGTAVLPLGVAELTISQTHSPRWIANSPTLSSWWPMRLPF
jgi:hypothetical protein